jgi:hypothetical protein
MKGSHDTGDRDFRDDDLRARFSELRLEEELRAPAFLAPAPASAGHRHWWPVGASVAITVCLIAMTVLVHWLRPTARTGQPEPRKPFASIMEWKPPTAFLLQTPGRELLRTVPAIGVWDDNYGQATAGNPKHSKVKKTVSP